MTLHAAKGLEFPVVFIVGCEKNLLPLNLEYMTADKEEERRLLYVGMTRAKERLYLLSAKKRRLYGQMYEQEASPFLGDIEEELKAYENQAATLSRRKRQKKDQMTLF
jgi:DNA helicase-2/ATP-dependent DNA helicase PcrA